MSREARRVTAADGIELVVHHLGGDGPPVMLAHATGFHGRCWGPMAQELTPSFSVWALDQRGHGLSGKAPDGQYVWSVFVDDLLTVLDSLAEEVGPATTWRAGGHSMGGAVALMAEARRPGTFSAICCYEPVVIPPTGLPGTGGAGGSSSSGPSSASSGPEGAPNAPNLAELARKRRSVFDSRQAAFDNYASKPPFSHFRPDALEAYVDGGFVDLPDGKVTLACRREDEADVFDHAHTTGAWEALRDVRVPAAMLAGGSGADPVGRVAPMVARQLPRGGFRAFPALDHFGPMVAPTEVGEVMAAALAVGSHPPA